MKIQYQRSLNKTYMVIKELETMGDEFEWSMIDHQRLRGFLPFQLVISDGQVEIWYEITGLLSLDVYIETEKTGYQLLEKLIGGLQRAIEITENYMLQESSLCIQSQLIYISPGTGAPVLAYVPGQQFDLRKDLRDLIEQYMQHLDHSEQKAVDYVYQIYRKVADVNMSILDLTYQEEKRERRAHRTIVTSVKEEKEEIQRPEDVVTKKKEALYQKIVKKKDQLFQLTSVRKPSDEICFCPPLPEETEHPTVLLRTDGEPAGKFTYMGERHLSDFQVSKNQYIIGKSQDMADNVLASSTVSRVHAMIIKQGVEYFMEDLNSINGTFLNGVRLNLKERVLLNRNDVVAFACEEFRFQ